VVSPARTLESVLLPQYQAAQFRKKQTQPNPLRLTILFSEAYLTSEKTKPIDDNCLISSHLKRKKAVFLKNMDQSVRSLSPISQKRTPHGQWRVATTTTKTVTNEAGMYLENKRIRVMAVCTIPELAWGNSDGLRLDSKFGASGSKKGLRRRSNAARRERLDP